MNAFVVSFTTKVKERFLHVTIKMLILTVSILNELTCYVCIVSSNINMLSTISICIIILYLLIEKITNAR